MAGENQLGLSADKEGDFGRLCEARLFLRMIMSFITSLSVTFATVIKMRDGWRIESFRVPRANAIRGFKFADLLLRLLKPSRLIYLQPYSLRAPEWHQHTWSKFWHARLISVAIRKRQSLPSSSLYVTAIRHCELCG